jgi:hypothetical protein
MVDIGKTLVRWSQLFPNITRVIGITALTIMAIVGAMSLLTVVVGVARMTWLGLYRCGRLFNCSTCARSPASSCRNWRSWLTWP